MDPSQQILVWVWFATCRIPSSWCVHRRYVSGNTSRDMDLWVYAVDALLHEALSQSEHRCGWPGCTACTRVGCSAWHAAVGFLVDGARQTSVAWCSKGARGSAVCSMPLTLCPLQLCHR